MRKIFILLFLVLFIASCSRIDPTQDELEKAKNIDIERTRGKVASMSVKYFVGDNSATATKERKGQPYYCISITNAAGVIEEFKGVPVHIFDSVKEGTELPIIPLLNSKALEEIRGKVIDKQANLATNQFFIVVEDIDTKIYRVEIKTYYSIDTGVTFPLKASE